MENQVGLVRERFFSPRLRVKSDDELNAWLLDQCVAYARAHRHPELRDQTVWSVFEAERPSLVPYVGRFDGFHAVTASVSKTCLICGSTTIATRSRRMRSGARSRSAPMPSGSSCARAARSSALVGIAKEIIKQNIAKLTGSGLDL